MQMKVPPKRHKALEIGNWLFALLTSLSSAGCVNLEQSKVSPNPHFQKFWFCFPSSSLPLSHSYCSLLFMIPSYYLFIPLLIQLSLIRNTQPLKGTWAGRNCPCSSCDNEFENSHDWLLKYSIHHWYIELHSVPEQIIVLPYI